MSQTLTDKSSALFGERFPYPFSGKRVLRTMVERFAVEFNQRAKQYLGDEHGGDRAVQWNALKVTGAYPTIAQECPRIAIQRMGAQPRMAGLGGEIDQREVQTENGAVKIRRWTGQVITETIEVAICTLNENLRDDLYLWLQQYLFDGIWWALPQLPGIHELICANAVDDQVEYQGQQGQPGFEFYIARLTYRAQYDLVVLNDVDKLAEIVNWQQLIYAGEA